MCLIFTILVFLGARGLSIIWWLFDPARWALVYPNAIVPILGIVFAPWTTLAYAVVAPFGIGPSDWFLLMLAIVADVFSYAGGGYGNRRRFAGAQSY